MKSYKDLPLVRIPPSVYQQLRKGSQWVYKNSLPDFQNIEELLPEGGFVRISSSKNPGGMALFDPDNAISLRVIDSSPEEVPFKPLLKRRILTALDLRKYIDKNSTNAFRLIHGEGDFLPGLTIDYYDGLLVIRPDCRAWIDHLDLVLEFISEGMEFNHAILLYEKETSWLKGEIEFPHHFIENSLKFHMDPSVGQKTGFFLDMRENRKMIGNISKGKNVLNCFAYTGAFSVYALNGGALACTNVEISKGAMETSRALHELNGFPEDRAEFIASDAFEFLENLPVISPRKILKEKCEYDLIILDPPAFAHSKEKVASALDSYKRLNQMAIDRLGSGQFLATASCSSRILPEQFAQAIDEAASLSQKRLKLIYSFGAGIDHPVALHSGIGSYLKFHIYMIL